ncbi:hypothetical protein PsorP6_011305 [Peronosclerospora sorghi]|uniref:Uncharacterized protein n=1 Tax=Peronosclerospora sorghi TaxID=230839 RepID=A0ACC0WKS8_9STRA|nr:hypothetical protein PsorP6_011305 [Peronosclerospora sorghi]
MYVSSLISEAKRWYERSLDATKELEQVAPALLKSEEELGNTRQCTSNHDKQVDFRPYRECGHGENETTSTNGTTSLPKANDLRRSCTCFTNTFTWELGREISRTVAWRPRWKHFKEVLLRDDENVVA